jgi:hypothetical protein
MKLPPLKKKMLSHASAKKNLQNIEAELAQGKKQAENLQEHLHYHLESMDGLVTKTTEPSISAEIRKIFSRPPSPNTPRFSDIEMAVQVAKNVLAGIAVLDPKGHHMKNISISTNDMVEHIKTMGSVAIPDNISMSKNQMKPSPRSYNLRQDDLFAHRMEKKCHKTLFMNASDTATLFDPNEGKATAEIMPILPVLLPRTTPPNVTIRKLPIDLANKIIRNKK